MKKRESNGLLRLSKRETEIMDVIYRIGSGSASDIRDGLSDPPGYSSVRKQLEILEEKGFVHHAMDGRRFIYHPSISSEEASQAMMKRIFRSFFGGDLRSAMVSLLTVSDRRPTEAELEEILAEAERAQKEGR